MSYKPLAAHYNPRDRRYKCGLLPAFLRYSQKILLFHTEEPRCPTRAARQLNEMSPNLLFSVVLVAAASLAWPGDENFIWTSGYCRQDGDAAVDTTGHVFTSPGSGTDEWCRERCDEDPSCVAFDNCNECWLHGAPRSTGVGGGCECWVKNLPKVTLYEDKSRGAGCDALDNSGNVVDADSADHCCQGEDYCCDYGSCASDSDYCGYRFRCGGAVVSWYEPADGVPLSGLESSQACESRGQRLCYYDELCPSGEDTAPVGMPSSHSDYMPFLSTTYGRRWMQGGWYGGRRVRAACLRLPEAVVPSRHPGYACRARARVWSPRSKGYPAPRC